MTVANEKRCRKPNQSLQQTKPPVTCRAEHGPRQPSSLLKHVVRLKGAKAQGIGFNRRFWLAHPCFRGRRCARSRLAHSSSLGAALAIDMAQLFLWPVSAQMFLI